MKSKSQAKILYKPPRGGHGERGQRMGEVKKPDVSTIQKLGQFVKPFCLNRIGNQL